MTEVTREKLVAKNLTELRERPKVVSLVELPHWLTLYADTLRSGIEPNPDTMADYFERAATEIASLLSLSRPAADRGQIVEECARRADEFAKISRALAILYKQPRRSGEEVSLTDYYAGMATRVEETAAGIRALSPAPAQTEE